MKFKPIFKETIWGGQKIKNYIGKDFSPMEKCGEMWVLSAVEGSESIVENGKFAENTLSEMTEIFMDELVGERVYEKYQNTFPLLIKIIDANAYLSVQVHPDDILAKKIHNQKSGKTEMWYVIQADDNAELIAGFNKAITPEEFKNKLNNKSLREILKSYNVKSGDIFYLPAGRIHAIGSGLLIAEIQQTSDITYRVYDWDRVDEKGNSRELHIENALKAIKFDDIEDAKVDFSPVINKSAKIVESPYFCTNLVYLNGTVEKKLSLLDSFVLYFCVGGNVVLKYNNDEIKVNTGECVLVPAIFDKVILTSIDKAKILEIYVP